jgi:hypothetical protein
MSLSPFEHLRSALIAAAALLALMLTLLGPAPAGAVIGGEEIDGASVPWFSYSACGGTLVAPDRIVTAAHCVGGRQIASFDQLWVGGAYHPVKHYALAPDWHARNGGNSLDDVAILELETPVAGVAPVPLLADGAAPPAQGWIVGRGRSEAASTGGSSRGFDGILRRAPLRVTSDAECAAKFKRVNGNDGERFDAARMLCAIDIDGVAPLSSGCNGDSGGPLYSGSEAAPVLLGIVSWGSDFCGADHTPSVFAEVGRYRDFITDPAPVWTPTSRGVPKATRHGSRLTCTAPAFDARPDRVAYTWHRAGYSKAIGQGRTFRPGRAVRGHRVACRIEARNAGGRFSALSSPVRS